VKYGEKQMGLRLSCPKCMEKNRLSEPYPLPGDTIACEHCSFDLKVAYPNSIIQKLKAKGINQNKQTNKK